MKRPKTIKADKLTRDMVRNMKVGETIVFVFPNFTSVENAKSTVGQMRKILSANFVCNTTGDNILSITRND